MERKVLRSAIARPAPSGVAIAVRREQVRRARVRRRRLVAGTGLVGLGAALVGLAFVTQALPGWVVLNTVRVLNAGLPFEAVLPASQSLLANGRVAPVAGFVMYAQLLLGALAAYLGGFLIANARYPERRLKSLLTVGYWTQFRAGFAMPVSRRRDSATTRQESAS
ncbi:MFS family permease [Natronocella acetinitrilica]|uniref:MFS family permease n=1 Tax=Natronocella acetinitrilica TaxID=414046 RepID=A0AAE3KBX2_9GAMM|nr:hypothetical protein [Natronocella acetinitrilica]MCP1674223.1 MFS family permease [Natronocella acetinitrilica]